MGPPFIRAAPRLESIAEVHGMSDAGFSPVHPPSTTDDQLAYALTRGESLEDFNSVR